ncbi:MAG: hypothetical protein SNJ56_03810 [Termitinemataceae bacterium]
MKPAYPILCRIWRWTALWGISCAVALGNLSCQGAQPAKIPLLDLSGVSYKLFTSDAPGLTGQVRPGHPLRYRLLQPLAGVEGTSLELEYTLTNLGPSTEGQEVQFLLSILDEDGTAVSSWSLPLGGGFLGIPHTSQTLLPASTLTYAIPFIYPRFFGVQVELKVLTSGGEKSGTAEVSLSTIQLKTLRFVPSWFGFRLQDAGLSVSPFVWNNGKNWVIDVPDQYTRSHIPSMARSAIGSANEVPHEASNGFGTLSQSWKFSLVLSGNPTADDSSLYMLRAGQNNSGGYVIQGKEFPPLIGGVLPEPPFPLELAGPAIPQAMLLEPFDLRAEQRGIPAEPLSIIEYRQELWRDPRFEVFQWYSFPEILIFDTASYDVQDRFFKRLAFFVEKQGFRGRLAPDKEIADLHGWNAHDYRSSDLADFFNVAATTAFPLNEEEQLLKEIVLDHGILVEDTQQSSRPYRPGRGAIISISRESEAYLRRLFMVHEAFHGLFFIDEAFQAFCEERLQYLDRTAKQFFLAYMNNRRYDITDTYLMKNELMAYCLQQPVSGAAQYFGKTLPARLEPYGQYQSILKGKDEQTGSWPELAALFTREAQAFSDYVAKRWGLEAGRVWKIQKRKL